MVHRHSHMWRIHAPKNNESTLRMSMCHMRSKIRDTHCVEFYVYIYIHTHLHKHVYIHIYMQVHMTLVYKEKERDRQTDRHRDRDCVCVFHLQHTMKKTLKKARKMH